MIVIHTIYYRYLDFFFYSYVIMISSNNRHFTLAGSAGSAGDPHVNVGTFFHLLSWMNHQVQGGAPKRYVYWFINPMNTIDISPINHSYWT